MKNRMKGLAHIGIHTEDVTKSMEFYTETLGFDYMDLREVPAPNGVTKLGFVNAGNLIIELVQPADISGIKDRRLGPVDHVAIEVDDIDGIIDNLKNKNVVFNTPEKSNNPYLFNGISNIFFKGPNGENLELFQYHSAKE
ncbi:MAG: VOC family protein [Clostridiales bacterium]|nr:VOC family protein [Clostridiales bacterium]